MSAGVVVRLVPKNRSRAPLQGVDFSTITFASRNLQPEPRMTRNAVSWLSQRAKGQVVPTATNRIELELTRSDFKQLFNTTLQQGSYSDRTSGRRTASERFERPDTELPVPDELADTIDFAYVPRPVEYYAPSFLPPTEDLPHLRLADVRAALNAARAHRQHWTGAGVKVAMVDSGFFPHPHFAANGYKLMPTPSPGAPDPEADASGHGTGECANIFAVAPDCTVFGVKAGPSAATALESAIALGPDVMTNSWGFDVDHQSREELRQLDPNFFSELVDIETLLADAVAGGIVVLFSAGNGHRAFPACMPQIIAAGGVTVLPDGALEASSYASSFDSQLYPGRRVPDLCGIVGSSRNTRPLPHHIMLPVPPGSALDGENLPSPNRKLGWGVFSGTSAACPQLAGVVALMRGIRKGASADQVRTALTKTATDITTGRTATGDNAAQGPDLATGAGLANARAACEFVGAIA